MDVKFSGLVRSTSWASVKMSLLTDLCLKEDQIDGYRKVYDTLLSLPVIDSDTVLYIRIGRIDPDDEHIIRVFGKDGSMNEYTGDETNWSLAFMAWEEWLGMTISEETLREFQAEEIIARSLYEMTYYGFTQREIELVARYMLGKVDEEEALFKDKVTA